MTINVDALAGLESVEAFNELKRLLGKSITYHRYKSETYDPDAGTVKTWYESPSFTAVLLEVSSFAANQDSRLNRDDKALIFPRSEFTSQASGDDALPTAKDEVTIDGDTYVTDLGGGETIYKVETADKLLKVYVRKSA